MEFDHRTTSPFRKGKHGIVNCIENRYAETLLSEEKNGFLTESICSVFEYVGLRIHTPLRTHVRSVEFTLPAFSKTEQILSEPFQETLLIIA